VPIGTVPLVTAADRNARLCVVRKWYDPTLGTVARERSRQRTLPSDYGDKAA
jgi:hypothetical protein